MEWTSPGSFRKCKISSPIQDLLFENPCVKFSKWFLCTLTFEKQLARSDENKLFVFFVLFCFWLVEPCLSLTLKVKTTIIVLFCPAWNNPFFFFFLSLTDLGQMPLHDFKPNKAEVSLENSNVGKKIAKRQSFKSTCWNYIYIVVETRYIFEVIRFLLSIHRSYQTKNRVLYVSNCCITLYGWHFLLAGLLFDEGELFQKYVLKHEYFT